MRFVSLGVGRFGVGGALAGVAWPLLPVTADYESLELYERPRSGTHDVVRVWEDERGRHP